MASPSIPSGKKKKHNYFIHKENFSLIQKITCNLKLVQISFVYLQLHKCYTNNKERLPTVNLLIMEEQVIFREVVVVSLFPPK